MKKELGITPGKWEQSHRRKSNGMYLTEVYDNESKKTIATIAWYAMPPQRELVYGEYKIVTRTYIEANAKLIADAGTTANECGLLPSELLAQRNELLEACTCAVQTLQSIGVTEEAEIMQYLLDVIKKAT